MIKVSKSTSKTTSSNNLPNHVCDKSKCNCVPSGMCHSNTLLGCPHRHYFNENNIWTCILPTK